MRAEAGGFYFLCSLFLDGHHYHFVSEPASAFQRQKREAEKASLDEDVRIPADLSYAVPGLSREMVEKLSFVRPVSLGQASRIAGVTPAAISILRMHLRRGKVLQH